MSIASPDKSMGARLDVLAFYRQLPFNYRTDAAAHATAIRDADPLLAYPPLVDQLVEKPSMIDIGCGAGWVVNSAAYHHGCPALGIDFNPVAVERARRVADALDVDVSFEVADLFKYVPEQKLELAISIGVLHHTDDCLGAIRHIAEQIVSPGGRLFIGLYHSHGRRPFLKHFEALKAAGKSEEDRFQEFCRLRLGQQTGAEDDVFLRSWFRDQVLHPHETCHTLAELFPLLDELGLDLESTSINRFAPKPRRDELLEQERTLAEAGEKSLAEGRYFPGFFVFLARRT